MTAAVRAGVGAVRSGNEARSAGALAGIRGARGGVLGARDTIPKPDGLGMVVRADDIEHDSNEVEHSSTLFVLCSRRVRR